MQLVEFVCAGIAILYFFFILIIFIQWIKSKSDLNTHKYSSGTVSVIVPIRNESANLPNLIGDLLKQKNCRFEVIIVDDHSEDNPENSIMTFIQNHPIIKYVKLGENKFGKKEAIEKGVEQALNDCIVTIDADVGLHENFLATHLESFIAGHKITAGLTKIREGKGIWSKYQELEMLAIQGVAYGMAKINKPISVSGANLSYSKNLFFELDPYKNNKNTLSGDDIYLLNTARKRKINVHFLSSMDSIAEIPVESFRNYFRQRVRWMKKGSSFIEINTVLSGLIIIMSVWMVIFGAVYQMITLEISYPILISILLKMVIDFLLLFLVAQALEVRRVLRYFLPVFLMNVTITSFLSIFGWMLPVNWKGRTN